MSHKMQSNSVQYFISMETHLNLLMTIEMFNLLTKSVMNETATTYYHVKDTTLIRNISLKDFLSDIQTKAELTEYWLTSLYCTAGAQTTD